MPFADTHIHSLASFDGHDTRADLVYSALKAGIETVCFTDHYDIINEKCQYVPRYDWEPARREHIQALQLMGCCADMLYGLELGNAPASFQSAEEALQEEGLDFVLGSIHNASKKLDWADYYDIQFTDPAQCKVYLDDYIDQLEQLTAWGNFDSLAHIPYPLRYMAARDGQPVTLKPYEERLRLILRTLVREGKALEINSGKSTQLDPAYGWLLDLYREEGGRLVTTGSDAHYCHQVGVGLKEIHQLLESKGFRSITVYRDRRPDLVRF